MLADLLEASAFNAESSLIREATSDIWIPNLYVSSVSYFIDIASSKALVPGPSIVNINSSCRLALYLS